MNCRRAGVIGWCLLAMGAAAFGQESQGLDAYRSEIDAWHRKRIESLKDPEGYLSLVGLYPMAEGANRFGSAKGNDLVFPAGSPPHAGVLKRADGVVRIEVTPGVVITSGGELVASDTLRSDAHGEPTVLEMGSMRFYVIDRSGDLYVRLKDVESERLMSFDGVDRFPVDRAWQIDARFEPYDPPRFISVPNVLGGEFVEECPGRLVFEVNGEPCSLEPLLDSRGRFFIVFGDGTSGLETYGGGRFLVADPPSHEGLVVLDFNRSYNPPCAFSPFATCPLPHEANRLDVRIEAGEKTWGEGH